MNMTQAKKKFKQLKILKSKQATIFAELIEAFPLFEEQEDLMAVLSYPDDFPESAFENIITHGVAYDYEIPAEGSDQNV